jgi:peptidoglycan hydrolase CwlO-like protein
MSTHDKRIEAVEKDIALMKHDIIYKIDDTNSALTILKGILTNQGRDLKFLINQAKGIDIRLEGLDQEVRTMKEQQDNQGQDIRELKRSLNTLEENFNSRFDTLEKKFDQALSLLIALTPTSETDK